MDQYQILKKIRESLQKWDLDIDENDLKYWLAPSLQKPNGYSFQKIINQFNINYFSDSESE